MSGRVERCARVIVIQRGGAHRCSVHGSLRTTSYSQSAGTSSQPAKAASQHIQQTGHSGHLQTAAPSNYTTMTATGTDLELNHLESEYDVVILGTGLVESLVAA